MSLSFAKPARYLQGLHESIVTVPFRSPAKKKSLFTNLVNLRELDNVQSPNRRSINGLRLAFTLRKKTTDAQAMLRIEKMESVDLVTFVLSGHINNEDLNEDLEELKSLLEKQHKAVILDMEGVNLIDREVVGFLANFETDQAKITNCPAYIREWIRREQGQC